MFSDLIKARKLNVKIASKFVANYHTHNYLCRHAEGNVADYAKQATICGIKTLGISDHLSLPELPWYMSLSDLREKYLPQFDEAQHLYGDKVNILKSVEIEYISGNDSYYQELLSVLDYIVLGAHLFEFEGKVFNSFFDVKTEEMAIAYCNTVIEGIKSGYFDIVAHPDVFLCSGCEMTPAIEQKLEEIVRTAMDCNVLVELNANGVRYNKPYPSQTLFDICKRLGTKVVISADCHETQYLCDEYVLKLLDCALENNLNVVFDLPNKTKK